MSSTPSAPSPIAAGRVLCLSGGGFRATLFHLGALRRLNELGILSGLEVITSVSGGSVLNGILATQWPSLRLGAGGVFQNFDDVIAASIRKFASHDLRTPLLVGTRIDPRNAAVLLRDWFSVRANFLAERYQPLFNRRKLREIAAPQAGTMPRFIFCATTMQTGACWHFHGGPTGRMGDFYTGYLEVGDVSVAEAVAASSAFPPGFGALQVTIIDPSRFDRVDPWGETRPVSKKRTGLSEREKRVIFLTDGGVYDNLGVEPIWDRYQRILISDAGHPFSTVNACRQAAIPRLSRVANISMEQVGAVRKRWLVRRFSSKQSEGAIWTINTPLEDYGLADAVGYSGACCNFISSVRTDFNSFTEGEQNCLENHGYSLADAACRSRVPDWARNCSRPKLPYAAWSTEAAATEALRKSHTRGIGRDLFRFAWASFFG